MRLSVAVRFLGLALGLMLFATSPARAEFLRAETEHFVIQGEVRRGEITEYARKVERFHEMLEMFLPPETHDVEAPKLWIYLAANHATMSQAWPGVSENVGGFYSRNDGRIYAVVNMTNEDNDTTLFHEYAHHYMFQYHNKAYPGWFVEGFAEYFAPSDLRMGRIRYGLWREGRLYSLGQTQNWIPMDQVLSERPNLSSARRGAAYYAQAWLLTHYMLGDPTRRTQFGRYLAAVQSGEASVGAFQEATGLTSDQLATNLRSYLGRGVTVYTLSQALPVAEVTVTALPSSTEDAIWLDLRSMRSLGDDKDALLQRVRDMAARHPGDRLPTVTLAKYLIEADLPAEAVTTLEPVIAANPADAEALWLMAGAEMDVADDVDDDAARMTLMRQAQRRLGAAYEADPLDYRVYMAMARNREGTPGYPTDNDLTIAESAYRLAPQLGSTAIRAARVLMAKEKYLEAVMVLSPLANNPHDGGDLTSVRTLLAQARSGAGLEPVSTDAPPSVDETEPAAD